MTLYFDLDLVVTGNLDDLFTYPGRFCMMQIWRPQRYSKKTGNSSVVRLFVGEESYIFDRFTSQPHKYWAEKYPGDQIFVSDTAKEITFYPPEWCVSFKDTLPRNAVLRFLSQPRLPQGAKIVVFFGVNTPPAAIRGAIDPSKSQDLRRRRNRFTRRFRRAPWIEALWAE